MGAPNGGTAGFEASGEEGRYVGHGDFKAGICGIALYSSSIGNILSSKRTHQLNRS